MHRAAFMLVFLFLCPNVQMAFCQDRPAWADAVDKAIANFTIANGPGGVIAIVEGKRVVYTNAFGYADVEAKIKNTPKTLFDIASCSKQFTAFAVLTLAEQGKIDLDKPIQFYLPEIKVKTPIPVHTLLTHCSGLHDYSELLLLARGREGIASFTAQQIQDTIFNQTNLSFTPKSRDNYSNSNYVLLAILVEKISEKPFETFIEECVFKPFGINQGDIGFLGTDTSNPNPLAKGYVTRPGKDMPFVPDERPTGKSLRGANGIQANVYGLAKWMGQFKHGKIGKEPMMDLLLAKDTLANGEKTEYARGFEWGTTASGYRWVQHTGRSSSTSIMLWWPDVDISMIALVNTQEIWAQSITNKFFFEILEATSFKPKRESKPDVSPGKTTSAEPIRTQPEITMSTEKLRRFAGLYPAGAPVGSHTPPSGGVGVDRIELRDGKLVYVVYNGYVIHLKPIAPTVLEMTGLDRPIQLRFVDLDNQRPGFVALDPKVNQGRPSEEVTYRLPKISQAEMKAFCGTYQSQTLNHAIPIKIGFENGGLFMQWGIKKKRTQLNYLGKNILTSWQSGGGKGMQCNLVFEKDEKGKITGFNYDGHRVWNLAFQRLK